MKKTVWRDPNHMLFESGHKTFDRQVDCISIGNVIGAVQFSKYIRPHSEISCGPNDQAPGYFRDFDLELWFDAGTPREVLRFVYLATENNPVILYEFHHHSRGRLVVHGYVVTTTDHRLLRSFVTGPTYKSQWVIDEAIKYITAEET